MLEKTTEPSADSLKRAYKLLDEDFGWATPGFLPPEVLSGARDVTAHKIARAIDEAVAPHVEALHGIRDDLESAMNSNRSPEIQLFATQMLKGWRTQLDAIEARQ